MTKAGVAAGPGRSWSAGPTPAFCKPALAKATPFIFGVAAPHSGFLIGSKCVLQTVFFHGAQRADGLGFFNCVDGGAGGADREEQCRLRVPAGGKLTPFGGYGEQVGNSLREDCDVIHKNPNPGHRVRQGIMAWIFLEFS